MAASVENCPDLAFPVKELIFIAVTIAITFGIISCCVIVDIVNQLRRPEFAAFRPRRH